MADDSTVTIRANFDTREAVDLAIEHPVQRLQRRTRPGRRPYAATRRTTAARAMRRHSRASSRSLLISKPASTHGQSN